MRNPLHYQSLDPAILGRNSEIALDQMSGMAALRYALEKIGEHDIEDELAQGILNKIKQVGENGRVVDLSELRYIVRYMKEPELLKICC